MTALATPAAATRPAWRAAVYSLARWLGLFALARRVYADRQCILAYHAFAFTDEHQFRPQLYMRPERFAARLDFLARRGYRFIGLAEAVRRLRAGGCRLRELAVTIDDGFTSVHALAAPVLAARRVPATLYLTTYHVGDGQPVLALALEYMAWKAQRAEANLDLARFGLALPDPVPLAGAAGDRALAALAAHVESLPDLAARDALLTDVGHRLGVPWHDVLAHGRFHLVTPDAARALVAGGIDLELHTHRHRFPDAPPALRAEIEDNRAALRPLGQPDARHLCYPSGRWRADAFAELAACGVESATTCEPGLNAPATPLLGLRRFLDADDISDVEFEAEVSGFKELLRSLRARVGGRG